MLAAAAAGAVVAMAVGQRARRGGAVCFCFLDLGFLHLVVEKMDRVSRHQFSLDI